MVMLGSVYYPTPIYHEWLSHGADVDFIFLPLVDFHSSRKHIYARRNPRRDVPQITLLLEKKYILMEADISGRPQGLGSKIDLRCLL